MWTFQKIRFYRRRVGRAVYVSLGDVVREEICLTDEISSLAGTPGLGTTYSVWILWLEQGELIYDNMRSWEQRVIEPESISEDHREEEYQRQETKSVSEMKLWDLELRN